jgi:hypothetical protein
MRAHGALLGDVGFFVPIDGAIGAGIDDFFAAFGFHRIDHDYAVFTLVHRAIGSHTRGVRTVLTRHREICHVVPRVLSTLTPMDIHPTMTVTRLGSSIAGPVIADILIFVGHKTVVAVVAQGYIYDHVPVSGLLAPDSFHSSISLPAE